MDMQCVLSEPIRVLDLSCDLLGSRINDIPFMPNDHHCRLTFRFFPRHFGSSLTSLYADVKLFQSVQSISSDPN